MFTALDFLKNDEGNKFLKLPQELAEDPERLRREFMAVVANRNEGYDIRSIALQVLTEEQLNVRNSPEMGEELIRLFNEEFPPEILHAYGADQAAKVHDGKFLLISQYAFSFPSLLPEAQGLVFTKRIMEANPKGKHEYREYVDYLEGIVDFPLREIFDLTSLARKLSEKKRDALSEFLYERFDSDTKFSLATYQSSNTNHRGLEPLLLKSFNNIIMGPPIYAPERFRHLYYMRDAVKELAKKSTRGQELIRLNQLLLEDAYPLELLKIIQRPKNPKLAIA